MSTPKEFAIKTDSGWVYPEEMSVYDGSTDKVVNEVYAWTGSSAELVWPVPQYGPGTTYTPNDDTYPLYGETYLFIPAYYAQDGDDYWDPTNNDLKTGDVTWVSGSKNGPAAQGEGNPWTDTSYAQTMLCLNGGHNPSPQYLTEVDSSALLNREMPQLPIMNAVDTIYTTPQRDWRVDISNASDTWEAWDYVGQGNVPMIIGAPVNTTYASYDGNFWSGELSTVWSQASSGISNKMGLSYFDFKMITDENIGNVTLNEADCILEQGQFVAHFTGRYRQNTDDVQGSSPWYNMADLDFGGLDVETFPQGLSSLAWDPDVLYTPSNGNWGTIEAYLDTFTEDFIYGIDTNIAYIRYRDPNGGSKKLRFDNLYGVINPGEISTYDFQWGSSTANLDGAMLASGSALIRGLPWLNESGTPFGTEDWTMFDPEYTKFLTYMSNIPPTTTVNYNGYDYLKDNYRRADYFTERYRSTGSNYVRRMQGAMFLPGEIEVVRRKPIDEARLLWQEIGCVVGAENGHTWSSSAANYACTPGTVTSFFPSGNTSMVRYRKNLLPRYYKDTGQQFEYLDYNGTDGDFKNYDGDFQMDFFDRSNYLELRIYNQTTGKWLRSYAWGEPSSHTVDTTSQMLTETVAYAYTGFSRFRPFFLTCPQTVNPPANTVGSWRDFYTEGDVIDFKLYSR